MGVVIIRRSVELFPERSLGRVKGEIFEVGIDKSREFRRRKRRIQFAEAVDAEILKLLKETVKLRAETRGFRSERVLEPKRQFFVEPIELRSVRWWQGKLERQGRIYLLKGYSRANRRPILQVGTLLQVKRLHRRGTCPLRQANPRSH